MKKLLFLLLFIPLVFACSDDSNSEDVNLEIGDYYEEAGGIIFSINTGGGGMVVTMQDIGIMNRPQAVAAAENNSTGGHNDWFLPSIYQLQNIYDTVGQGGGNIGNFENAKYWSSTQQDGGYNWVFNFSTGNQQSQNVVLNYRVRAVRYFP